MTEEEAVGTKLCPRMFAKGERGDIFTGGCFGSTCMAWRWAKVKNLRHYETGELKPVVAGAWYRTKHWHEVKVEDKTKGYCGLAGVP